MVQANLLPRRILQDAKTSQFRQQHPVEAIGNATELETMRTYARFYSHFHFTVLNIMLAPCRVCRNATSGSYQATTRGIDVMEHAEDV